MSESFTSIFRGQLQGIMTEEAYVKMAQSLEGNWYAIPIFEYLEKGTVGADTSDKHFISGAEAGQKLLQIYEEVKQRKSISGKFPHTYVKNRDNPSFIKLYDPKKCGGSCSTVAPDPWWVFSTVAPTRDELLAILSKK